MTSTTDASTTDRWASDVSTTDLAAMQGRAPRIEELVEHAATLERDATLTALTDQALEQQLVTQTVRIAAATSRSPGTDLDARPGGASAEAPDLLSPQHWSADDPLQVDLLIAILEQELGRSPGVALEQVA